MLCGQIGEWACLRQFTPWRRDRRHTRTNALRSTGIILCLKEGRRSGDGLMPTGLMPTHGVLAHSNKVKTTVKSALNGDFQTILLVTLWTFNNYLAVPVYLPPFPASSDGTEHLWTRAAQPFYGPGAVPVTQPTAPKQRKYSRKQLLSASITKRNPNNTTESSKIVFITMHNN